MVWFTQTFYDSKTPKEDIHWVCLSVIAIDSTIKRVGKY